MRPVVLAINGREWAPTRLAERDLFITGPERLVAEAAAAVEGALVVTDVQMIRCTLAQFELGFRRAEGEDEDDDDEGVVDERIALMREVRVAPLLVIVVGRLDVRADREVEGLIYETIRGRQAAGFDRYLATWVASPVERPWRPSRCAGSQAVACLLAREFLRAKATTEGGGEEASSAPSAGTPDASER